MNIEKILIYYATKINLSPKKKPEQYLNLIKKS